MQPPSVRLGHVSLRVRELDRSRTFYGNLFGFEELDSGSTAGCARLGLKDPDGPPADAVIVLTRGLPAGAELLGVDHFGFEVRTAQDVDRVYSQARAMHAQATQPRVHEGQWQTFIFDPDGYKVGVFTTDANRPSAPSRFATSERGAHAAHGEG